MGPNFVFASSYPFIVAIQSSLMEKVSLCRFLLLCTQCTQGSFNSPGYTVESEFQPSELVLL